MKKMRNFYRFFTVLLSLSILITTMPAFAAQADTSETISTESVLSRMDLSLNDELAQAQEILAQFKPADSTDSYVFEDPQRIAAPYIPEGALCTELAIIGQAVIFDYRMDDVRYIVDYRYDGTVGMTSSVLSGSEVAQVYSVESASESIQKISADEIEEECVTSEAEIAQQLQQALSSEGQTEATAQIQASTSTVKEVNPLSYQNDSDNSISISFPNTVVKIAKYIFLC